MSAVSGQKFSYRFAVKNGFPGICFKPGRFSGAPGLKQIAISVSVLSFGAFQAV